MDPVLDPALAAVAARQGGVFLRRQAIAAGYDPRAVDETIAAKAWRRVRYGAYALPEIYDSADERARSRLRTHAVVAASELPLVVSGASAAVLHGLDLDAAVDLRTVDVTLPGRSGRRQGDVRRRDAELFADATCVVDGLMVTSVARTAIDIARDRLPLHATMITIDSALRLGRTSERELHLMAERESRWPGSQSLARYAGLADGLAQTPGETVLRLSALAAGVAELASQVSIFRPDGCFIGVVDLVAFDRQTVLEMDGLVKYGIDGRDPRLQVLEEKRREDGLRRQGLEVERFLFAESRSVGFVQQRMDLARARASGRPEPSCLYRFNAVGPGGIRPASPLLGHAEARAWLAESVERQAARVADWHRSVAV